MMVFMPVFAPRCHLKGTKPPDVLTGVHAFRQSGFQMQEAVYKALHVEAIRHSKRAKPKQTGPAKKKVTEAEGGGNKWNLQLCPEGVSRPHHVWTPLFHARRLPLIEPSKVSPPESAMTST